MLWGNVIREKCYKRIEDCTTYKRFYCLMDDKELREAKEFCDSQYKPEAKTEKAEQPERIFIYIIIEETLYE